MLCFQNSYDHHILCIYKKMYLSTISGFEQKICLVFWKKKIASSAQKKPQVYFIFFSIRNNFEEALFYISLPIFPLLYILVPCNIIFSFLSAIVEVEVNVICSQRVESSKLFLKQKVHIQVFNFQSLQLNIKFLKQIKTISSI